MASNLKQAPLIQVWKSVNYFKWCRQWHHEKSLFSVLIISFYSKEKYEPNNSKSLTFIPCFFVSWLEKIFISILLGSITQENLTFHSDSLAKDIHLVLNIWSA